MGLRGYPGMMGSKGEAVSNAPFVFSFSWRAGLLASLDER